MNKQYQSLIKITGWAAMIILAGQLFVLPNEGITFFLMIRYAAKAVAVAVVLAAIYERCLWRYNPFEKTPKLHKVYKGKIKSEYDNTEREATIEIKQTLLSVDVVLITNESRSNTISASISDVLGEYQLIYHYLNKPKTEFRYRSEVHFGTAVLSLSNTDRLVGDYYTDRNTKGQMEFNNIEKFEEQTNVE